MTRLFTIPALSSLAIASVACVATTQGRLGVPVQPSHVTSPAESDAADDAAGSGRAPGEDEHWFTAEDYLVSEHPYTGEPRPWIRRGKMISPPTGSTKSEARFLLTNGKELWTAHYWRSRVAEERDLAIGALIFCAQNTGRAILHKRLARRMLWVLGPVTDLSDLYKGSVAVGSRDCYVRSIRVPIE